MTVSNRPALLPARLRDVLPPQSITEAHLVQQIARTVTAHGYDGTLRQLEG